jgi:hypothetical protein
MTEQVDHVLDGNAAAGMLRSMFAVDLTGALGQCDGCGRRAVLAEARLYVDAPGMVGRCGDCDAVLFRAVTSPDRAWFDFRGLRSVQISLPTSS